MYPPAVQMTSNGMRGCRGRQLDDAPFLQYIRAFVEPWLMPSMAFCSGLVFVPDLNLRRRQAILRLICGYFICQARTPEDPPPDCEKSSAPRQSTWAWLSFEPLGQALLLLECLFLNTEAADV